MAKNEIRVTSNDKASNCTNAVNFTSACYELSNFIVYGTVLYSFIFNCGRYSKNNTLSLTACNYWTGCDTGLIAVHSPVTNSTSYDYYYYLADRVYIGALVRPYVPMIFIGAFLLGSAGGSESCNHTHSANHPPPSHSSLDGTGADTNPEFLEESHACH